MSGGLPPSASVAHALAGTKLHAPSADRNADALCTLLQNHAPRAGKALEIASGTGQHMVRFAAVLPDLIWQPTDVASDRLRSIDAYVADAAAPNVASAQMLDATRPGWHQTHGDNALILLINLLHLISTPQASTLIAEAAKALTGGGALILYGPFKRDGALTSTGDAQFHADLIGADPAIGYKDDVDVLSWLTQAGLSVTSQDMPANNLAFIARKAVP